jgi:hypothetical protein
MPGFVGLLVGALGLAVTTAHAEPASSQSFVQSLTAARYVVTAEPIDVGGGLRICLAVDQSDLTGVWHWMPAAPDCSRRASGPTVTEAEDAVVARVDPTGPITVRFRIGVLGDRGLPFASELWPRLSCDGVRLRVIGTGSEVPVRFRNDLEIPGRQLSPGE